MLALVAPSAALAQGGAEPQPPSDAELATVTRVIDGDTIKVTLENGDSERVRYIGMDTPELANDDRPAEPYGPQATAANARFVEDQVVLLETDTSDRDRFERLLRYVWVETEEDGWVMVNERLVALGLAEARAYQPDTKYQAYLEDSEQQAALTGRGMHAAYAISHELVGAEVMAYLFIDAYDARDASTLRQLMSRDIGYTKPGPEEFQGRKAVLAEFREEWEELEPDLSVRNSIAQPDAVVVELTISIGGAEPEDIEAIAVQRWPDDILVDYRLYRDE
jgi:endonuclease YncB( thermonuclease family)